MKFGCMELKEFLLGVYFNKWKWGSFLPLHGQSNLVFSICVVKLVDSNTHHPVHETWIKQSQVQSMKIMLQERFFSLRRFTVKRNQKLQQQKMLKHNDGFFFSFLQLSFDFFDCISVSVSQYAKKKEFEPFSGLNGNGRIERLPINFKVGIENWQSCYAHHSSWNILDEVLFHFCACENTHSCINQQIYTWNCLCSCFRWVLSFECRRRLTFSCSLRTFLLIISIIWVLFLNKFSRFISMFHTDLQYMWMFSWSFQKQA